MVKFNLIGILALIVGIILLFSPAIGLTAIGILSGLILAGMGIWMVFNLLNEVKTNQSVAFVWGIFAMVSLVLGFSMIFQVITIDYLGVSYLLITGILIIIAGVLMLSTSPGSNIKKYLAIGFLLLGFLYLLITALNLSPLYIAIIIGLGLIIYGLIVLRIGR